MISFKGVNTNLPYFERLARMLFRPTGRARWSSSRIQLARLTLFWIQSKIMLSSKKEFEISNQKFQIKIHEQEKLVKEVVYVCIIVYFE